MIEQFSSYLVYQVLSLNQKSQLAESLNFFIYDTIKVFLLLAIMIFLVSILRTYITREKIKKILGGKREGIGNIFAALLGIPTPFCSCSAVPIFIGFIESGVPLGITFSFLIAAPMINEIALALLFSLFGWKIALLYIISGLFIAIFAGIIIGRLNLEDQIEDFHIKIKKKKEKKWDLNERLLFAKEETLRIIKKVGPYIILGVGFGAFIHGFVPADFLADIAGKDNPLAVPIAVLIGIPLYANAGGVIPIVQALISKGMAIGTALAFMMSVTALSFPEMIILRKVIKSKLLGIFIGILAISFVFIGLLFNLII
ncbi:MAG: permease [Candidatus Micrarchaeia archaeon]